MLFNSFVFIALFLPIVLIVYFTLGRLHKPRMAMLFLIVASLYFYSYYELYFLYIIFASMAVNYCVSHMLSRRRTTWLLVLGVLWNVGLLGYFKYADFFIANVNRVLASDIALLSIALPLGISFITFQQIAYLVDVYRRDTKPAPLLHYTLFITFFPQLIAGPIVNAREANKRFQADNFARGLFMFVIGLVKKVVLADTLALWVDDGYAHAGELTFAQGWLVAVLYIFQLYFDFSGYCDMAIGLALMFNIRLPINFDSPLKSRNIREFWRRWHMTLNRFLTNYVYYPLGGSRKGVRRTYVNIAIIFFISGFWHGAGWTFVIWGLLQGAATIVYNVFAKTRLRLPYIVSWALTFLFTVIAFVYFRATSVEQAHHVLHAMLTPNIASMKTLLVEPAALFQQAAAIELFGQPMNAPVILLAALAISATIIFLTKNSLQLLERFTFAWRSIVFLQLLLAILMLRIFYVQQETVFIYFNF